MIQPTAGKGTWMQHVRAINNSSRNMGTYVLGGRGTGKSWLLALVIALQDFLAHRPQVIFDPLGTTSRYFLYKLVRILSYLPKAEHAKVWERVVYCDMSGQSGFLSPFPLYFRRANETLQEIAERILTVIELSSPGLVANVPLTWPSSRRLGLHAGTILSALGFQPTELEDLLFNTLEWERTGRFQEALRLYPEDASPAVSYFRTQYGSLSRSEKHQRISPLLDHVFKLTSDKHVRAVFCAKSDLGINWSEVAALGQTVILDFSRISNPATKRFAMLWAFQGLDEFIKQRERNSPPFGIIIDEFASLTQKVAAGTNPLATLLDEFIQQYMRNSNIWLTITHQTIQQLDEQLRNTVLSLANYYFFQAPTMEAARLLADALYLRDPYWVKYWHPIFSRTLPWQIEIIAERPEFMPLDQQQEIFAQRIRKLPQWSCLLRPAVSEGEIGTKVYPITIRSVDLDPVTGEHHFPERNLLDRLYPMLAAKSGIPITDILREQEARLTAGTSQKPPRTQPLPAAERTRRQPVTLPDGAHPEQQKLKTDPSLPTLDDQQKAFLALITEHPADTPVSSVYKRLSLSWRAGNQLRDSLITRGYLTEIETRAGKVGRPTKVLLPTFSAFALLGKDPPPGRGGAVHRHIQQVVAASARAKGYTAKLEHELGNGGIVDVHLEKGQETIAVEIAIVSTPEREIHHIKQCLTAGYDKAFAMFSDEGLLRKTQEALPKVFSAELRMLSEGVGKGEALALG